MPENLPTPKKSLKQLEKEKNKRLQEEDVLYVKDIENKVIYNLLEVYWLRAIL